MSGNVGLNMFGMSANTFGLNLQPVNTNYENDVMMPDFLKTNNFAQQTAFQGQTVPAQSPQVQSIAQTKQTQNMQQQSVFTKNTDKSQISQADLNQYIMAQDPSIRTTEKGNLYKQSTILQKLGVTAGILTPTMAALAKGLKAFKSKSLWIKIPVLGVLGYALGALADKFVTSYRAQVADKVNNVE